MTVVAAIFSLAAGLIVACVTALVALWRYRAEKLWDRKLQSYQEILTSLHALQRITSIYMDYFFRKVAIDEEESKNLREDWRSSFSMLRQASALATLLISSEIQAKLFSVIKDIDSTDGENYLQKIYKNNETITIAIGEIIEIAKIDLRRGLF